MMMVEGMLKPGGGGGRVISVYNILTVSLNRRIVVYSNEVCLPFNLYNFDVFM